MASKSGRISQFTNHRMRVIIQDNRELIGQFLAFDKHMNLVLADTEEFRRVGGKGSKEEKVIKRSLGLIILRGEIIVSMSVEAPPPPEEARTRTTVGGVAGPGIGRAAGRGLAVAPVLNPAAIARGVAPPKGLGGPAQAAMMPRGPPGPFPGGPPPPGFVPGARGPGGPMGRGPGGPGMGGPPPGMPGGPHQVSEARRQDQCPVAQECQEGLHQDSVGPHPDSEECQEGQEDPHQVSEDPRQECQEVPPQECKDPEDLHKVSEGHRLVSLAHLLQGQCIDPEVVQYNQIHKFTKPTQNNLFALLSRCLVLFS